MTPKFFWVAPTYRVNVALIFSLEDQFEPNPEYSNWLNEYTKYVEKITNDEETRTNFINYIKDNLLYINNDYNYNYNDELPDNDRKDNDVINLENNNDINNINVNDIDIKQSINENTINEYIYSIIGYPPEEEIHTYVIILQNGLKVEIAQDKFYAINDIIDKYGT